MELIVAAFREGLSPESIRAAYPNLSLEQVYGGITYYLGQVEKVEQYMREQDQLWNAAQVQYRLPEARRERLASAREMLLKQVGPA